MPLGRRRPLLRAAAVGGGAYMAGKHRAGTQAGENEPEEPASDVEPVDPEPVESAPPPAPPEAAAAAAGPSQDAIERLTQLGTLHDQGVLTDEEFTRQKTLLLG